MPKEEVGVWSLYLSVTSILELLRNGFIRNPMITNLVTAETPHEKGLVISSALMLHGILVFFVTIFLLVSAQPLTAFWHAPGLDILFYIYAVRGLVLIPSLHFEFIQQSRADFKAIFITNSVRLAPLGFYSMVCYYAGIQPTLIDLSIVLLISTVISVAVAYWYIRREVIYYPHLEMKQVKDMFNLGKYTMGTVVSSMVVRSTDSWMVGRLVSTIGVALYNPALRIANLVEVPTLAIANLVFPQINKKMKEKGDAGIEEVYVKSVSLILAIMLPGMIPLYLLSDFVVELIFGKDYMEAAPILRVTIFFMLIIPFNRQFGTVMDALKRPKLNFYLLIMMGVLNVIFIYLFISWLGLIGAAYGTLLSYIIIFILNQIILARQFKIKTWRVFTAIPEWYVAGWGFMMTKVRRALS